MSASRSEARAAPSRAPQGGPEEPPWAVEVRRRVVEILAPLVQADGGSCELRELNTEHVVLCFSGRCAGCPGWQETTHQVAEPLLKPLLPDGVVLHFVRRPPLPRK